MRFTISILVVVLIAGLASTSSSQTGWFPLKSLILEQINGVHFINADTGFVWGHEQGIWRTTDGGNSWSELLNISGTKMRFFHGNKLGFFFRDHGIYQTTDHGESWMKKDDMPNQDVSFPSKDTGYAIAYGWDDMRDTAGVFFAKTINGGISWDYKYILQDEFAYATRYYGHDLVFRDNLHGIIRIEKFFFNSGNREHLFFFTTDGGESWHMQSGGNNTRDFIHLDNKNWIVGDLYGISLTTDDFASLEPTDHNKFPPSDDTNYVLCHPREAISVVSSNKIYTFGGNGVYLSSDGGQSWYLQFCGKNTVSQYYGLGISMVNSDVGYFVGLDSQVYKTNDGGGQPLSVVDLRSCDCKLLASPSQANSHVDITFEALKRPTTLEVFDAIGRRMATEVISEHISTQRIDISTYPSGVYFIRLDNQTVRFIKQ